MMRGFVRSAGRPRLAQVLVEFALILPLAVSMLAAIVELGTYLHRYIGLQSALREGARVAVQAGGTDDRIRATVLAASGASSLAPGHVMINRRPADPEFASVALPSGESVALKDRVRSYQSVEIRVEVPHSAVIPTLYQGQPLTSIVGSIRTLQVSR